MISVRAANTEGDAAPIAYPPAPEGQVIYVIGDIHGRRDLLEKVFGAIDRDKARALATAQVSALRDYFGRQWLFAVDHGSVRFSCSLIGPNRAASGLLEARGDVLVDGTLCGNVQACQMLVEPGVNVGEALAAKGLIVGAGNKGIRRGDALTLGPALRVKAEMQDSLVVEQPYQFQAGSHQPDDPLSTHADGELSSPPAALEIYLGDYIDRGEDSRGVVDALLKRAKHVDAVFLRGNHEQFLLDFLAGSMELSMWKHVGATETLQSYGVQLGQLAFLSSQTSLRSALAAAMPKRHARFYADTIPYVVVGPYLFVHAGLRPGVPLEQQHPADLMSIRQQFLKFNGDFGHIVVHGHTPGPEPDFKPNRINLDTGAYSTGRLTCLKIGREGPQLLVT